MPEAAWSFLRRLHGLRDGSPVSRSVLQSRGRSGHAWGNVIALEGDIVVLEAAVWSSRWVSRLDVSAALSRLGGHTGGGGVVLEAAAWSSRQVRRHEVRVAVLEATTLSLFRRWRGLQGG
jgi:hypothetical protein